ncbi:MAG: hypothetical protein K0Q51_594 [Rickettsiaceae bacterium]|jgi:hypothetical protein|nr:hypothetical protein [Rickettsiaceae bacterium]
MKKDKKEYVNVYDEKKTVFEKARKVAGKALDKIHSTLKLGKYSNKFRAQKRYGTKEGVPTFPDF